MNSLHDEYGQLTLTIMRSIRNLRCPRSWSSYSCRSRNRFATFQTPEKYFQIFVIFLSLFFSELGFIDKICPPSSLKISKKSPTSGVRKQKIWADCLLSKYSLRGVFEKFFSYQKSGWGPFLYYVSKGTGWVGEVRILEFLLTFCTFYADV